MVQDPLRDDSRLSDLKRFYGLLETVIGSDKLLSLSDPELLKKPGMKRSGVYFFLEPGELRSGSGEGLRVVRVGQTSNLLKRLKHHKGNANGGGHHRVSVFRKHVGTALIKRDGLDCTTWGGPRRRRDVPAEKLIERTVSKIIGAMPVLWLAIDCDHDRCEIELNAIALLSNSKQRHPIDKPSKEWLGHYANKSEVMESGLWNVEHTNIKYKPDFIEKIEKYIDRNFK